MATSVIGALRAELSAGVAKFADDMDQAGRAVDKFAKRFKKVGASISSVGKNMSLRMSAPIVAFGGFALKAAGDFEAGMNRVEAVSGAASDELANLRDLAKEMGRTTQFSASEAADAMGFLAMAGFEVDEIMGALPGTLELAAAAQMDLGTAADIVSNVLSGYGLQVEELARVNDVLAKTMSSANTDLEQLGEAMKYAGPLASAAGVSFEEAAAALGLMGNAGIQASMAGTTLRGAISKILGPTKKAEALMREAGLSFTDAEGRLLPLADIIRQLEPHAENAGLFMELFGQRAGPGMAALVSQGSDALSDLTAELLDSSGTASGIAAAQMKGFNGAMRELKSAFEALQIAIADSGLLQTMTDLIKRLSEWTRNMAESNPQTLKWITIIAAAAAALGPLVFAVGMTVSGLGGLLTAFGLVLKTGPLVIGMARGIGTAVALMGGPITLIVSALAGLAAAWIFYGDEITAFVSGWIERIDEAMGGRLSAIIEAAKMIFQTFVENVRLAFEMIGQLLTLDFAGALETFSALWSNTWNAVVEIFGGAVEAIMTALSGWFDRMDEAMGGRLTAIVESATRIFQMFIENVRLAFQMIGQLLTLDFAGALQTFNALWGNTWNTAVDVVGHSVEEIATWIKDRLGAVFDWLGDKVETVKGFFASLYEAVVGGSYIPDMVDGIIAEMQRLDDGFVGAAEDATRQVGGAFEGLSDQIGAVFAEILKTGKVSTDSLIDLAKGLLTHFLEARSQGGGGGNQNPLMALAGSFFGGGGFGGFLADGGLAMAGRPYVVGERGPELFRPHITGTVDPQGSAGGVTQVFNVQTPDANSFRRSERQILRSARERMSR